MKKIRTRNLTDRGFIAFYHRFMILKGKRYCMKNMILDNSEVMKIQSSLWRTVEKKYIENDGGVYLTGIGYLCHIIKPERKIFKNKMLGKFVRMETNGHLFRYICLEIDKKKPYYHLYKNINGSLKKKCLNRIKSGFIYKFYYNEVVSWIKIVGRRKDYAKNIKERFC